MSFCKHGSLHLLFSQIDGLPWSTLIQAQSGCLISSSLLLQTHIAKGILSLVAEDSCSENDDQP
jgi:hypothetical protein